MIYQLSGGVTLDDNSLALIVTIIALLGWKYLTRLPLPQLNPFILGRQSRTSPTRLQNQTPVYTSAISGGIISPQRPNKTIRTIINILNSSNTILPPSTGSSWIKGGERLSLIVQELKYGLMNHFQNKDDGFIAILIQEPNDALLVTLALSLTRLKPLLISPSSAIPSDLSVTIVGVIHSSPLAPLALQLPLTPDALWLQVDSSTAEDLLVTGKALMAEDTAEKEETVVIDQPTDLALAFLSDSILLEFTHLNITASLVAWLGLFPPSPPPQVSTRPTVFDTILSFHHPSTPYGFGLALLAIYTNASLFLPSSTPVSPSALELLLNAAATPVSTLVFIPSTLVGKALYAHVLQKMEGDSSLIIRYARTGKLNLLRKGIITQDSYWDWILFRGVTKDAGLGKLRALFVEGPLEQSRLDFFRIAFGCAVTSTLEIATLLAPLTSGMMHDVQRLPPLGCGKQLGHVGSPGGGIELKLIGDEELISAGTRRGEIVFRSAMLPSLSTSTSSTLSKLIISEQSLPNLPAYPNSKLVIDEDASIRWCRSGLRGEMSTQGVIYLE